MKFTLVLSKPVPNEMVSHLKSLLAFCDPKIVSINLDNVHKDVLGVVAEDDADKAILTAKIQMAANRVLDTDHIPPTKVLHRIDPHKEKFFENIERILQGRKFSIKLGEGIYGIADQAAQLLRIFDDDFRQIALKAGATEAIYPSLLEVDFLNRIDYFKSMPQYITIASHLYPDISRIDSFMQNMQTIAPSQIEHIDGQVAASKYILSPTICYHLYNSLKDSALKMDNILVTAVGKCYRWESSTLSYLRRLWEFWMRELIIVGKKDMVIEVRESIMRATLEYCQEIDLWGWIENANDPFFSPEAAKKSNYQRGYGMKWELRIPYNKAHDSLAVASFNNMQRALCGCCAITMPDGKVAFSGCIGWGLERWVYAFYAQHGINVQEWPAKIRRRMNGNA